MPRTCKTPPVGGGASRDCCGWLSHSFLTAPAMQAQMRATRFSLSPWMAQDLARLCFGRGLP